MSAAAPRCTSLRASACAASSAASAAVFACKLHRASLTLRSQHSRHQLHLCIAASLAQPQHGHSAWAAVSASSFPGEPQGLGLGITCRCQGRWRASRFLHLRSSLASLRVSAAASRATWAGQLPLRIVGEPHGFGLVSVRHFPGAASGLRPCHLQAASPWPQPQQFLPLPRAPRRSPPWPQLPLPRWQSLHGRCCLSCLRQCRAISAGCKSLRAVIASMAAQELPPGQSSPSMAACSRAASGQSPPWPLARAAASGQSSPPWPLSPRAASRAVSLRAACFKSRLLRSHRRVGEPHGSFRSHGRQ